MVHDALGVEKHIILYIMPEVSKACGGKLRRWEIPGSSPSLRVPMKHCCTHMDAPCFTVHVHEPLEVERESSLGIKELFFNLPLLVGVPQGNHPLPAQAYLIFVQKAEH